MRSIFSRRTLFFILGIAVGAAWWTMRSARGGLAVGVALVVRTERTPHRLGGCSDC